MISRLPWPNGKHARRKRKPLLSSYQTPASTFVCRHRLITIMTYPRHTPLVGIILVHIILILVVLGLGSVILILMAWILVALILALAILILVALNLVLVVLSLVVLVLILVILRPIDLVLIVLSLLNLSLVMLNLLNLIIVDRVLDLITPDLIPQPTVVLRFFLQFHLLPILVTLLYLPLPLKQMLRHGSDRVDLVDECVSDMSFFASFLLREFSRFVHIVLALPFPFHLMTTVSTAVSCSRFIVSNMRALTCICTTTRINNHCVEQNAEDCT
jgi:hypothetical protein